MIIGSLIAFRYVDVTVKGESHFVVSRTSGGGKGRRVILGAMLNAENEMWVKPRVGLGRGWIRHPFRSGRFATRGFALLPPAPSSFWMRWDEGFAAVEELNKSL